MTGLAPRLISCAFHARRTASVSSRRLIGDGPAQRNRLIWDEIVTRQGDHNVVIFVIPHQLFGRGVFRPIWMFLDGSAYAQLPAAAMPQPDREVSRIPG